MTQRSCRNRRTNRCTQARDRVLLKWKPSPRGLGERSRYPTRVYGPSMSLNSMIDLTPTYWPFDVLGPLERTPLHDSMLRFFNATYDAGFQPFVTNGHSEIGFGCAKKHDARFILRGGRGKHWEPWLTDSNVAVRLGPIWVCLNAPAWYSPNSIA